MKIKHMIGIGMIPSCFIYKACEGVTVWMLGCVGVDIDGWCEKFEKKIIRWIKK